MNTDDRASRLKELAWVFLKLGTTAFGGPAAHIAMMEEEFVRRRRWLSESRFLDLIGITNLIPGPNSTEMAIHIGYERAGMWGLLTAGLSFIIPAMLIVLGIAWSYVTYGRLPEVQGIFYGMKPVIIAIVAQAVWNLTRKTATKRAFLLASLGALIASLLGWREIPILLAVGALSVAWISLASKSDKKPTFNGLNAVFFKPAVLAVTVPAFIIPFSKAKLFWFFLKVGSVLYGSGYVLLAFLQGELVDHYGWLTKAQLLDATAVGQFTPGPVFTTATFIGYLLSGVSGACIATAGIFLPSFFFVGFSTKLIPWMRRSKRAGAFLDGVNAASLGLMAAVTLCLGRESLVDGPTILLALVSMAVLIRWKINSVWLVLTGALFGLLAQQFS